MASIFVKTNGRLLNILERDFEILQQQLGQYNSINVTRNSTEILHDIEPYDCPAPVKIAAISYATISLDRRFFRGGAWLFTVVGLFLVHW